MFLSGERKRAEQGRMDISMSPTREDVLTDIRPYELSTSWWLWGWTHVAMFRARWFFNDIQEGSSISWWSCWDEISPTTHHSPCLLDHRHLTRRKIKARTSLPEAILYVPLEWTLQPGSDNRAIDSKCPFNMLWPSTAIPWFPGKLDLPSYCPVFIGLDSANGADGDLNHESLSSQV